MKKIVVIKVEVGDNVFCDVCDEDYTQSEARGGFLFGSKAVCPACSPRIEASAERYNETSYIKKRCAEGQTFYNFILSIR